MSCHYRSIIILSSRFYLYSIHSGNEVYIRVVSSNFRPQPDNEKDYAVGLPDLGGSP